MDKNANLKQRTKQFACRVFKLVKSLPRSMEGYELGRQLLRAAMSVGANYRAACRSRSRAEFSARIGVVEEEADECSYWMEMIIECGLMDQNRMVGLLKEADELTAIMTASRKTAQKKNK